jgi:transposase
VYDVHDWAEARRLHRQGLSKTAIADRLGMSRNTASALVARTTPPRYERGPVPSKLDGFVEAIAAMLDEDEKVAATVVLDHLRRQGYAGGITILKQHLAKVRPAYVAARSFQRTTYLPGELAQIDWWHTGLRVAVGKGASREVFGLVATLPHSAAHACAFTFSRTTADLCPALLGCLASLGGIPEAIVFDNDASIVASRRARTVTLVEEVAALFGHLAVRPVALRPAHPEGKGQVERTIRYLETSFLPLRRFASLADVQAQHDSWARSVAFSRRPRRLGATVAEAWAVERASLRRLPDPLPDVDRHLEVRVSKDGFVRVGGVDYSVPPGLAARRVGVRLSLTEVVVRLEGEVIARHVRSFIPTDVVVAPAHARALRLHREARARLAAGDVEVPVVDLARYDVAVGMTP